MIRRVSALQKDQKISLFILPSKILSMNYTLMWMVAHKSHHNSVSAS